VQIEAALEPHEDPDVLDSLTWDLWKLGELPHPELAGTQLFVYEHSPCGYCRRKALENLLRFDRVPDWVRDEAVHDGCDDTRAWAREHLGAG